jgi:hypothetical protein
MTNEIVGYPAYDFMKFFTNATKLTKIIMEEMGIPMVLYPIFIITMFIYLGVNYIVRGVIKCLIKSKSLLME